MAGGDIAGGFAQGFSSVFRPGARAERQRLQDVMRLEQEKFDYTKQHDTQQMDFQRQQEAAMEEHRDHADKIAERGMRLQQRAGDLEAFKSFTAVLDSNMDPRMREFMLKKMAPGLGVDPKSEEYKDFSKMILGAGADTTLAISEAMAQAFPGMEPGQFTAAAKAIMSGKVPANAMFDLFLNARKTPELELKPVVDPATGKPIYKNEADAEGMEVPPSSPTVSIQNQAETTAAKGLAEMDIEQVKKIAADSEAARGNLPAVATFKAALQSKKFIPGSAAGIRLSLGRWSQFLGIDPGKLGLGENDPVTAEVMDFASKQLAIGIADNMSRLTNMSLTFVQEAVPGLTKTPGGNKLMADMFELTINRQIAAGRLLERYRNQYGTLRPEGKPSFFEALDQMRTDQEGEDEEFAKRIQAESEKGQVVEWDKIPGVSASVEAPAPSEDNGWIGLEAVDKDGKVLRFDGKQWLEVK